MYIDFVSNSADDQKIEANTDELFLYEWRHDTCYFALRLSLHYIKFMEKDD